MQLLCQLFHEKRGMNKLPSQLLLAIKAFMHGRAEVALDYSIPDFVRAIESIIAIPKGKSGTATFAERCLTLSKWIDDHTSLPQPYRALSTFQDIYERRNQCVHGKQPFQKELNDESKLAEYEFVAMHSARNFILSVLCAKSVDEDYSDRARLERAWETELLRKNLNHGAMTAATLFSSL